MRADFVRVFAMWDAVRPRSGFRPEAPEERHRVLVANDEMGYAVFREMGMPEGEARNLAKQIHGGPGGLFFLQISFGEHSDD
jgi:hypothetical protein